MPIWCKFDIPDFNLQYEGTKPKAWIDAWLHLNKSYDATMYQNESREAYSAEDSHQRSLLLSTREGLSVSGPTL